MVVRDGVDSVIPSVIVDRAVQGVGHEVKPSEGLLAEKAKLPPVVEHPLELLSGYAAGQVVPYVAVDGVLLVDDPEGLLEIFEVVGPVPLALDDKRAL